ncbi:MAG TPA: aminopeptidase P family protein [Lapillicoccus sp.]|nr:aminopeptidase P family protein [Lapillicoccus sp.]
MDDAGPAPFTAEDFAARRDRAAQAAREAGLDGLVVTPGPDLSYLAGYAPMAVTERLTVLVVPVSGDPVMVVPRLERPEAEAASGVVGVEVVDWADGGDPYETTARLLTSAGRYAISDSAWAMHLLGLQGLLPQSSYVSMTSGLPMLRAVKDPAEVERLAAAGAAADRAYEEILTVPFAGRRETEVAADLADLLRRFGHSQVDFTVVGSGPNGANPHHEIGERVIENGDMVVLDFGGLKYGYGSDTTRTVHVGEPTDEEHEVHEIVCRAQQAGFDAVRPGARCQDVDRAARTVIADAGYGDYFIHRTGHGIGMEEHEDPYIIEGNSMPLQPGHAYSVEPGIYIGGRWGMRLEDIVVATDDGPRALNTADHRLVTLDV